MPSIPDTELPNRDPDLTGEGVDFTAELMAQEFVGLPRPELLHRKCCSGVEGELRPASEKPPPGLASRKHLLGLKAGGSW